MVKHKKLWMGIICVLIIAVAICGKHFMSFHIFSSQVDSINESEIEFLSDYYVDDAENIENRMLTDDEKELLLSYRALTEYMEYTYSDLSYSVTDVLPSAFSDLDYDMYCVLINGSKEYTFHTIKDDSGIYVVVYDEYLYT